jgi:hypothetical protein
MALFIATAIVESGTQIGNLSAGMMEDPRPPRTTLEPAGKSPNAILLTTDQFTARTPPGSISNTDRKWVKTYLFKKCTEKSRRGVAAAALPFPGEIHIANKWTSN